MKRRNRTVRATDDDIISFGSGSTGVSGVYMGADERFRMAGCAWCDRELSARYSTSEGAWIYPRHQKLGVSGVCAGGGAQVPPGAFHD